MTSDTLNQRHIVFLLGQFLFALNCAVSNIEINSVRRHTTVGYMDVQSLYKFAMLRLKDWSFLCRVTEEIQGHQGKLYLLVK